MIGASEVTYEDKNMTTAHEYRLLTANAQYQACGNHNFFIDGCFKSTDAVRPVDMSGASAQSEEEMKSMRDFSTKLSNMSTAIRRSDQDSGSNSA